MESLQVSGNDFGFCTSLIDSKTAEKLVENIKILGILSIISSSLSIIGAGSVIIFVVYNRICRSPDVNSLFHLSIADLLLALFWITGPIIHFKHENQGFPPLEIGYFCATWQALCEMVHLMTFFLTVNYALNVFLRMKEKKDRIVLFDSMGELQTSGQNGCNTERIKSIAYLVWWLLPMVLIAPLIFEITQQQASCQRCIILLDAPRTTTADDKLGKYNGYVLMIATLTFAVFSIIVLYVSTLRMYRKTLLCFHTNRQRVVIKAMTHRATAYVLVFIYCWTPALILASLRLLKRDERMVIEYFSLYVIQTLSAPLQGFLNSLVYGWSRKTFRDAVTRESRNWLSITNNYGTLESPSTSLMGSADLGSS
ncbi:transmembrane protein 116-like isoform X2 [Rhopilema esculentum]|uniref:transmembrane protein 116-like isoform X1 n=1 Tax=Rhopilema esculentum TaxID=499914 RepID=UPI0031E0E87F